MEVGTPLIAPVAPLSDNPAGSDPEAIDQFTDAFPPLEASVCEYEVPTIPFGRLAVVTVRSAAITIESAWVSS